MKLSRLAVLPLAAGLALGGVVAAASAAPVVTDVLATLPIGSQPRTLVVDGASNVYTLNADNTISKVGFDGTLTAAWATLPAGTGPREIVTTTDGTLYSANFSATISRVLPDGTMTAAFATLPSRPTGLALAGNGSLYTANQAADTVSKVFPTGVVTATYASLSAGAAPFDIAVTPSNELFTLNQNNTVSKVSAAGIVTAAFATLETGGNAVNLVVGSNGHVFVLEGGTNQVEEFDATGAHVRNFVMPTMVGRLAIDSHDNLFVTLPGTKSIALVPNGGTFVPSIATLTPGADYGPLAVTSTNTVYAVGQSTPIISRISLGAKITSASVNGTAEVGGVFSATVTASGYEPLSYALAGAVPPGVSINATTGVISGKPTAAGTYRFSVVASNLFGSSSSQEATLTVTAAPPTPTPTPTPTSTSTAVPTPGSGSGSGTGSGSGSAGSGRGGSASGTLASTGAELMVPGVLALALTAAGVSGLVIERRRRRA